MIASPAKTVNPLHSGVTIQQNDDKIESALRALTFGKIGQHRGIAKLLMVRFRNRDECLNSNRCAGYKVDQQERCRIRNSSILGELIAGDHEIWREPGFRP